MEKYKLSDNMRASILDNADLGYTLVAYYKMEFEAMQGWLGKWFRENVSFKSVTETEKEVITAFCEWFTTTYNKGYEATLLNYIGQGTYIELPIDDVSLAVVRFINEDNSYSTRIQLYRKL